MDQDKGRISFHGAAGTVTGSRTLVEGSGTQVLVDAGLFQGLKELRLRNWDLSSFDVRGLEAIILTHAHIDHSGFLPRLVREGFRGPVYATEATAELADILLRDSAHLQEEEAEYANQKGYSRHKPALPLYALADVEATMRRFEVVEFHRWHSIGRSARFRFAMAGHIVGSGTVEIEIGPAREPRRILFSGDLGRYDAPLVTDPEPPPPCDVLVIESTYGDRRHPRESMEVELQGLVQEVVKTEGILLVPCFAVGRAQQLIYVLRQLMAKGLAPEVAIHVDSPMAVKATTIYRRYAEEPGLEKVGMKPCGSPPIYGRGVHMHCSREESIRLNSLDGPRIILAGSGMLTGGRVLHHLRRLAQDARNIVALAGFQAAGTRGRRLRDGEKVVRVHGRDIPVLARIVELSGFSAHADCDELLRWVEHLPAPSRTFVTHGEQQAAAALAERLTRERNHHCTIPRHLESFEL